MIEYAKDSDIVKIQLAQDKVDVFSGKTFRRDSGTKRAKVSALRT